MCGCLSLGPHWEPDLGWPATQACALTGNLTSYPLVHSPHSIHWATPAKASLPIFEHFKKWNHCIYSPVNGFFGIMLNFYFSVLFTTWGNSKFIYFPHWHQFSVLESGFLSVPIFKFYLYIHLCLSSIIFKIFNLYLINIKIKQHWMFSFLCYLWLMFHCVAVDLENLLNLLQPLFTNL